MWRWWWRRRIFPLADVLVTRVLLARRFARSPAPLVRCTALRERQAEMAEPYHEAAGLATVVEPLNAILTGALVWLWCAVRHFECRKMLAVGTIGCANIYARLHAQRAARVRRILKAKAWSVCANRSQAAAAGRGLVQRRWRAAVTTLARAGVVVAPVRGVGHEGKVTASTGGGGGGPPRSAVRSVGDRCATPSVNMHTRRCRPLAAAAAACCRA